MFSGSGFVVWELEKVFGLHSILLVGFFGSVGHGPPLWHV
jgi:hypothetical protein